MNLIKVKTQVDYMNVAKAIGIIAVVIAHSSSPLDRFINLWHMPLFFFISGYFYKDIYTSNIKLLVKKRIKSLYVPYLKYEILYLILHNLFFKVNFYNSKFLYGDKHIVLYNIKLFIKELFKIIAFAGREPMAGVFWFFTVLFFVNILFALISYFTRKYFNGNESIRFLIVLFLFLVGNLFTHFGFTIPRFNNSLVILLVYYIGYMYKKYESFIKFNVYIALICFIFLCSNCAYGTISVSNNNYLSPDFLIINSIIGIYLVLYVSKFILKKYTANILIYIGKNTIIIMALQFISFKFAAIIQIYVYKYPLYYLAKFPVISGEDFWWILYSIVGISIPILSKYIYDTISSSIKKGKKICVK